MEKRNRYLFWKLLLSRVLAILLLPPALVVILVFAFLVLLYDFGNPFYVQMRLGYRGKEFPLFKIRSMFQDAEQGGAVWAEKEDSRVLPIGRFMRKTRIDELPQIWNILRGEMCWIGPRPERKIFADEFAKEIPNFHDRLQVKPGLTGYAQINGGYDLSPQEKLKYDLYYMEHLSFGLDVKIFFQTILVIFKGDGAR